MPFIAIVNGPNLNLLGQREPEIYGHADFSTLLVELQGKFTTVELRYYQSNVEGELINKLQEYGMDADCAGIVLNAGGYSHTSVAIADAVAAVKAPVLSVHISNIYAREPERRTDLIVSKCVGMICGLGLKGYHIAIDHFYQQIKP